MNKLQRLATKIATNKNTPVVLMAVACSGVVVTGIMAAKGRLRAEDILEDLRAEGLGGGIDKRGKEKIPFKVGLRNTWKCYVPAVGAGLVTVTAIVTMNRVAAKNAAILTAGATLATTTLKEYQQHVLEEIGVDREAKIRKRISKGKVAESDLAKAESVIIAGGESLCYDTFSGQYFKCSPEEIRSIENDLNREILHGSSGAVSLNEVYLAIGAEANEIGETHGFNIDNMIEIFFDADLTKDKRPVLAISFINPPVVNFANFTS